MPAHSPTRAASPYLLAGLLFLAAFLWRFPFALRLLVLQFDEVRFSVPTIARILAGDFPLYAHNASYMAPVHEYCSALLFRLGGPSIWAFRLPAIFFGSLAIAASYLNLRRIFAPATALAGGLLLAAAHSALVYYTLFSFPTWGFGLLLVPVLQAVTFRVDERRTTASWVLLGLTVGFSTYVFKITVLQSLCSAVWLALRSKSVDGVCQRYRDDRAAAAQFRKVAALAAAALLLWLPVFYRYFTRRETYAAGRLDLVLIAAALLVSLIAVGLAWRAHAWPLSAWRKAGLCALAAAVIYLPPTQSFTRVEQPRLLAHGAEAYDSSSYNLRHIHEWPFQVRLFLERIMPPYLLGRIETVSDEHQVTAVHSGRNTALSLGFLALLAAGGVAHFRAGHRLRLTAPHWVFVAPFLLAIAMMVPSWSLHNDWCFRYLLPFHAGFFVLVLTAWEPWTRRWPRVSSAVLAVYLGYCGLDHFRQLAWYILPPTQPLNFPAWALPPVR